MKLKINHNSNQPLHLQAEMLLRTMIREQEYIDGKLLPNEVELSKQLQISRNTLRQAINKLTFEGLLIRKKGYGTKVAKGSILSGAKNWLSFTQEMHSLGITVCNFELHISRKCGWPKVAAFFSVPEDEKLVTLERLRGKENFPFVYFISQFSPSLKLSGNEDFTAPLYDMLQQKKGVTVKTSKEEISAQIADKFLADKLDIAEGEPILVRQRYVFDVDDRPVEYNVGYYRADSFVYTIECTR